MTAADNIMDALSPRLAGTTEGMTLQVLAQIRDSLAAQSRNMTEQTKALTDVRESLVDVRERVIRLEERDKRLEHVEADVIQVKAQITILMNDKSSRDGAARFVSKVPAWITVLIAVCTAVTAIYFAGRQVGVVPPPPVTPVRLEATVDPESQKIEGTVGGKP